MGIAIIWGPKFECVKCFGSDTWYPACDPPLYFTALGIFNGARRRQVSYWKLMGCPYGARKYRERDWKSYVGKKVAQEDFCLVNLLRFRSDRENSGNLFFKNSFCYFSLLYFWVFTWMNQTVHEIKVIILQYPGKQVLFQLISFSLMT